MVKLEACVRAAGDKYFQRLQEITRIHYSCFDNDSDLLEEFKSLLRNVPTYVPNWSSPEITPDTYWLYGRKIPANDTTRNLIENIRSNITSDQLREKASVDKERIRFSHSEWIIASAETSRKLDKKVKEPSKVLYMNLLIMLMVYIVKDKWLCYMNYQIKK